MEQTQTITALKAQKRNPERISVYLDGQYAFGLARIVAAWLAVGQSLSEAKIAQLRKQDALEKAYQSALHLLSYRQRSEQEIRRKLLEKGFDQEDCERVLERLKTRDYRATVFSPRCGGKPASYFARAAAEC